MRDHVTQCLQRRLPQPELRQRRQTTQVRGDDLGVDLVLKDYTMPATSRFDIDSSAIPELQDESFGALITVTNFVPIIVERSIYWDSNGNTFSGGTNATGIPLTKIELHAQVTITGINGASSFSPNPWTVHPGQSVAWLNADAVVHRLVADDGSFDTGNIAPGANSIEVTLFSGAANYHCSIHPSMTGTIYSSAAVTSACRGGSCP
jgi:plastocyanin